LDARNVKEDVLFDFRASKKTTTSLSMSKGLNGIVALTGINGVVQVWDVLGNKPSLI